jgi:DNA-binding NarL/FixJ family response regulator
MRGSVNVLSLDWKSGPAPGVSLSTTEVPPASAIVVSAELDTRIMLCGLLRLHHFRVLGEAEGEGSAVDVLSAQRPSLMILDATIAEGTHSSVIASARRILPDVRIVLIGLASHPPPCSPDPMLCPDSVLLRPFRLTEFAEAVRPVGRDRASSREKTVLGEATS